MMMTTAGPAVTCAGQAAIFERDGVVVVAAGGVALAGRPIAGAVADLDEVAESVAGVVGGGPVPVVTVVDRNGLKIDGQLRPVSPARFTAGGARQP